jgi:hypothetical protein
VLSKLDHRVLRRKKERKRINGEYPVSVSPIVLRVCIREFEHKADEAERKERKENGLHSEEMVHQRTSVCAIDIRFLSIYSVARIRMGNGTQRQYCQRYRRR